MASTNILHMDMDAFFASVEQRDNPDLRGKCVIVGGKSQRGVVAAASYEARRYGIHSAMPIFQAKQRCPDVLIVSPRRKRYVEVSRQVMAILRTYSPLVEPLSIDEAFVDISGCSRLHGSCTTIAQAIKDQIYDELQLTCSIGVAPVKFIAKIASDLNKPDGLTIIEPEQITSFIDTLPINKVPGVGRRTMKVLSSLGIATLGQVTALPTATLDKKLGKFGRRLQMLAEGRDDATVEPSSTAKSVSTESTFAQDTRDRDELARYLLKQSQSVARQLRRINMRARTVSLILKSSDFQRVSRSFTLPRPSQSSDTIYQTALQLLDEYALPKAVRLVGIGASGLQPDSEPVQLELFKEVSSAQDRKWEKVDRTLDALADRFGVQAVTRGVGKGKGRESK